MSFQYRSFDGSVPLLVMIDTVGRHLVRRNHLGRSNIGGIIANCRKAMAHARALGLDVGFVRDAGEGAWISGLAPQRSDMLFERQALSCHGNRYFAEVASRASLLVVAGFPGEGGAFAIAADTLRSGRTAVFLQDALLDSESRTLLTAPILDGWGTQIGLSVMATHRWIAAGAMAGGGEVPPLRLPRVH